jgi:serine/threonine-protein kinase
MMAEPMHSPVPSRALDSRAEALAPGRIVDGKYRIGEPIAFGGMGVVLAATHVGLERSVAFKCIRREYVKNSAVVERFLNEARALARLRNEHVARVLDFGQTLDGLPYLVMERLDGADLYAVLAERGPLPVSEAVDYVLQSCQAAAEAHSLGIVHRDIKPENLFLTRGIDGRALIKVLDFGISKQLKSGRSLTNPSAGIGSPWYMSPEQIRRPELVDSRSDIWSLGVVLFELLTRSTPFDGETVAEVCAAALTQPTPSASARVRTVPQRLDEVLERCLAKTRELRYENVAELARALAPFGSADALARVRAIEATLGIADARPDPSAKRKYRRSLAVTATAVLVIAAVAGSFGVDRYRARLLETATAGEIGDRVHRASALELPLLFPAVVAEREVRAAGTGARQRARDTPPSAELPLELLAQPSARAIEPAAIEGENEGQGEGQIDAEPVAPLPELPRELVGEAP